MKQYLLAAFCVFLMGCSAYKMEAENMAASENTDILGERTDDESSADTISDNYSGEWLCWNNADLESEGGVSLRVTMSGQNMEAKLSAWSSNYNRLADADLSGIVQDNKVVCRFDDDGRGHTGVVQLTLKDNTIQMEITIDKNSANGDFTFPEGTTILQRKNVDSIVSDEYDPIESDNTFPLSVYSENGSADFYVSFDDTYESLKKKLNDSAVPDGLNTWEEYTEYTVLNRQDIWPLIQSEKEYMEYASIMYTMIEPARQNVLIFIEEGESALLRSALTSSSNAMSEKGISCGDNLEDIEMVYGKNYKHYTTEKNEIYEYKTFNGYLRFFLDSESKAVVQWGIDRYSFEDLTNVPM